MNMNNRIIDSLMMVLAVALSCTAAWYSVAGLASIFAGAVTSIAVMGVVLEASKIVVCSWLYRNWSVTPLALRTYFCSAIAVLMILTSMGIFGYLSKAHSDSALVSGDVGAKLVAIDERIAVERESVDASRRALKQLDASVEQVMSRSTSESGAVRSTQIRRSQQAERTKLAREIESGQQALLKLSEERAPIAAEMRVVEAEVGPIKYVAALLYGNSTDSAVLEKAVRFMILMIVFAFDPLAVLMFIAVAQSSRRVIEAEPDTLKTDQPAVVPPVVEPETPPDTLKTDQLVAEEPLPVVEPVIEHTKQAVTDEEWTALMDFPPVVEELVEPDTLKTDQIAIEPTALAVDNSVLNGLIAETIGLVEQVKDSMVMQTVVKDNKSEGKYLHVQIAENVIMKDAAAVV